MGLTAMEHGDPPDPKITLVVADDHNVMRSGLRMLLDAESDFEVVAEASDVLPPTSWGKSAPASGSPRCSTHRVVQKHAAGRELVRAIRAAAAGSG
jgi:hypothetical protein